jgi:hypothetical protein
MPRRNWNDARHKVELEGACRVCVHHGQTPVRRPRLEAAHIVGQKYDKPHPIPSPRELERGELYVRADEIVPLCQKHHREYDAHQLDLLPYLHRNEQVRAVEHLGIAGAYRRLTGSRTPPP